MTQVRAVLVMLLAQPWDMGALADDAPTRMKTSLRGAARPDTWLQSNVSAESAVAEAKLGQPDAWPRDATAAMAEAKDGISLTWRADPVAAEAKLGQPDAWPRDATAAMAEAKDGTSMAWKKQSVAVPDGVAAGVAFGGWRVPNSSDPQPPSDEALVGMVTWPSSLTENDANVEASRPWEGYAGSPMVGFHGPRALEEMADFLHALSNTSATASPEAIFACARDENCLDVWGTDPRLLGQMVLITKVFRSWDMAATSTSTRCHMKSHLQDAWCHRVGDRTKGGGRVYMAYAVPAAHPAHPWLPLAYVCHSMPGGHGFSGGRQKVCHAMSGRDFVLSP
jgi:hypothetical protein